MNYTKEQIEAYNSSLPTFRSGMTKYAIGELAEASVNLAIEDGQVLRIAEAISAMSEFVDFVRKNDLFINAVVEEANKNSGKIGTPGGAKVEVCETGTRYNFSHNAEWVEIMNREKEVADKRKALEDILKKIPAGKVLVDEDSGETLVGPSKISKTNYKLSLPK